MPARKRTRMRGGVLRVRTNVALQEALETGCGFALNRAEDCGWKYGGQPGQYEMARAEAVSRMANEIGAAIDERFEQD